MERRPNQGGGREFSRRDFLKKGLSIPVAGFLTYGVGKMGQEYVDRGRQNEIDEKVEETYPTENVLYPQPELIQDQRDDLEQELKDSTPRDTSFRLIGRIGLFVAVSKLAVDHIRRKDKDDNFT